MRERHPLHGLLQHGPLDGKPRRRALQPPQRPHQRRPAGGLWRADQRHRKPVGAAGAGGAAAAVDVCVGAGGDLVVDDCGDAADVKAWRWGVSAFGVCGWRVCESECCETIREKEDDPAEMKQSPGRHQATPITARRDVRCHQHAVLVRLEPVKRLEPLPLLLLRVQRLRRQPEQFQNRRDAAEGRDGIDKYQGAARVAGQEVVKGALALVICFGRGWL